MKCPYCGADTTGEICEYCGSELPNSSPRSHSDYQNENVTQNVTNIYYVNSGGSVQQHLPVDFPSATQAKSAENLQPACQSLPGSSTAAVSSKNRTAALLLCLFFGYIGAHLFYVGRWKKGLVYLFTCGILGFGWFIDIFVIGANKFKDAQDLPLTGRSKKIWLIILAFFAFYFILYLSAGSN